MAGVSACASKGIHLSSPPNCRTRNANPSLRTGAAISGKPPSDHCESAWKTTVTGLDGNDAEQNGHDGIVPHAREDLCSWVVRKLPIARLSSLATITRELSELASNPQLFVRSLGCAK